MMTDVRRLVACLTMLLPFEALSGATVPAATPSRPSSPSSPSLHYKLDHFTLLLPKLPLMPSACRLPRQYRSVSQERLQRQPCYYA